MAIVLYKKGNTHIIDGIKCDLKRVEPKYFTGKPDEGWFFSPREAYEEVKEAKEKPKAKTEAETSEKEVLDYDSMNNKEIREHAEKAGFDDWHTARIQPLKERLKA